LLVICFNSAERFISEEHFIAAEHFINEISDISLLRKILDQLFRVKCWDYFCEFLPKNTLTKPFCAGF
jgi:hypothetical protein